LVLTMLLFAGCAARRPSYVVVPRATSRSEEPVPLPLTGEGRQRLEAFFNRAGHPQAPDPVPDPLAAEHARALDALADPANLQVDTTSSAARAFCDDAAPLCRTTALFRNKALVRQVVDARETRRPMPAPLAVADGGYWWIFKVRAGRLSEVLLVCAVERSLER
jgi:hypothetical protein